MNKFVALFLEYSNVIYVIVILVALLFIPILIFRLNIKCPKCKKKGYSKIVKIISIDQFSSEKKQTNRYYYKCKKCKHEWSSINQKFL